MKIKKSELQTIIKEVISELTPRQKKLLKKKLVKEAVSPEQNILAKKLKELGFSSNNIPELTADYKKFDKVNINPKEVGPMAPVFTQIEVELSAGVYDRTGDMEIYLKLDYNWKHINGSNGYDAVLVYKNGKWGNNS